MRRFDAAAPLSAWTTSQEAQNDVASDSGLSFNRVGRSPKTIKHRVQRMVDLTLLGIFPLRHR